VWPKGGDNKVISLNKKEISSRSKRWEVLKGEGRGEDNTLSRRRGESFKDQGKHTPPRIIMYLYHGEQDTPKRGIEEYHPRSHEPYWPKESIPQTLIEFKTNKGLDEP
jgi:hypothetical protein